MGCAGGGVGASVIRAGVDPEDLHRLRLGQTAEAARNAGRNVGRIVRLELVLQPVHVERRAPLHQHPALLAFVAVERDLGAGAEGGVASDEAAGAEGARHQRHGAGSAVPVVAGQRFRLGQRGVGAGAEGHGSPRRRRQSGSVNVPQVYRGSASNRRSPHGTRRHREVRGSRARVGISRLRHTKKRAVTQKEPAGPPAVGMALYGRVGGKAEPSWLAGCRPGKHRPVAGMALLHRGLIATPRVRDFQGPTITVIDPCKSAGADGPYGAGRGGQRGNPRKDRSTLPSEAVVTPGQERLICALTGMARAPRAPRRLLLV